MKTIIDFTNKVRSLVDGRMTNIANVETSPSTHPYAVGKQLIFNGLLCKATSAIAVGDTLAVGTNLALSDNVVEQIYSLNQGLANSLNEIADMNNVLGAKNLLPNNITNQTVNGVTFTVNDDGSITANGTATSHVSLVLAKTNLEANKYKLSGVPNGSADNTYFMLFYSPSNNMWHDACYDTDADRLISNPYSDDELNIIIRSGQTVSNITFKPMIRPASITDDTYVPYSMTNREMTPYVQSISNPNLLDNPWFTVNQRGITTDTQTEGTTRYTVDRWILRGAPTITVNTDSIVINNSTGTSGHSFYQKIEENIYNKIKGKTVTLSIDAVASASGCMVGMWQGNQTPQAMGYKSIPTTRSIVKSTVKLGNVTATSPFEVLIDTVSGATLTIYSIKLELGTVSTLAMDSVPNYQQELAKCQRYFVRFNPTDSFTAFGAGIYSSNNVFAEVTLPTVLRAKPNVSYSTIRAHSYGRNDVNISSIIVNNYINNIVSLKCAPGSGANFVNGDYCEIQLDTNNYLDLSCDL